MARYTINYSCGHTEDRQLYGKHSERERKIEWFEREGLCSECWKKKKEEEKAEKQKEYEKENAISASAAADYGYPDLKGTQKQIAWAITIREKILKEIDDTMLDEVTGFDETVKEEPEKEERYKKMLLSGFNRGFAFREWLLSKTEAEFWIDNRDTPQRLLWFKCKAERKNNNAENN